MSIRLYNSLTKRKEDFVPLEEKKVNMYSCGVTVYDKCHIGHARSLYIFDIIRRYLTHRGFKVNFVRNITDVDDKIINKANELNRSFDAVVNTNIEAYYRDLENLALSKADEEPRATKNIAEMIEHIEALLKSGYAYQVDGDVYYRVRKFENYGKLSGQSIEKMLEAVRIDPDSKKKDPLDFALWKKSKEGEPSWDSPWGKGRPGWHIECSCMSMKYLKTQTLDIHAGGRDLIFPHHENEIAQSEAFTGKPFAKYWIHHGLLTINGQKMAKSSGNFITVDEVLEKYNSDILKLFFLQAHYRSPIDFSWEKIEEVKKAYTRILILKEKLEKQYDTVHLDEEFAGGAGDAGLFKSKFEEVLDDDFNTPEALAVLFDMITKCNKTLEETEPNKELLLAYALKILKEMLRLLGLNALPETKKIDSNIETLLNERQEARAKKDFKLSDQLRDQIKNLGYSVEDSKDGQILRKI